MWVRTLKQARRLIVAVVGGTLLLAGVVMLVTPGPGWVTIFVALSILGAEFLWAERLLKRLKDHGTRITEKVLRTATGNHEQPD